ncbi:MAG: hypothetical protein NC217_04815 [Muribaculaceae bacterium]|nr:hypothetical protein [Muribaculaceae bacterium]
MDMERILQESHPDFIISGGHLSDGISTNEMSRLGVDNSIVLFTEDSELIAKANNLKVVYSALKPVTRNDVHNAILKMEQLMVENQSDSANSHPAYTNSLNQKSNSHK